MIWKQLPFIANFFAGFVLEKKKIFILQIFISFLGNFYFFGGKYTFHLENIDTSVFNDSVCFYESTSIQQIMMK